MTYHKKLIEVALPLEAIDKRVCSREVHPARASLNAAPMVVSQTSSNGASCALRTTGG